MTFLVAPLVESSVAEALAAASALVFAKLVVQPGVKTQPTVSYDTIGSMLQWAFPGFPPPTSWNAQTVAQYTAECIDELAAENFTFYQLFLQVSNDLTALNNQLQAVAQEANVAFGQIGSGVSPGQLSGVEAAIQGEINGLTGTVDNLYNASIAHTNTEIANLSGVVDNLYNESIAHTNAEIGNLSGVVDNLYNESIAHTNAVEALLTTGYEDLFKTLGDQLGQVETQLEGQIKSGVDTAEQFAVSLSPGITAAAITGAVTQLAPQLQAINTELTTCLEPLCDTVTPNASQLGRLGQLIKDLEGLVDVGILAGLLTAAVADPAGTATVVVDLTGWMSTLGVTLADAAGAAI